MYHCYKIAIYGAVEQNHGADGTKSSPEEIASFRKQMRSKVPVGERIAMALQQAGNYPHNVSIGITVTARSKREDQILINIVDAADAENCGTSRGRKEAMKVIVHAERCQGHARCLAEGPDVFILDDLGYNSTSIENVPPHLHEQARRGALSCPELAITIIEE